MYVRQIDIPTIRLGSKNRKNDHIKDDVCRLCLFHLCGDVADQSGGDRLLNLLSGYPLRCVSSGGQYRCAHVQTLMSRESRLVLLVFHFVHARQSLQRLLTWIARSLRRNRDYFVKQTACAISWTIEDVLIPSNTNSDRAVILFMNTSQLNYRIC